MAVHSSSGEDAARRRPGVARRTARRTGRVVTAPPRWVGRRIRRATHAQGAGESGLGKLIEVHAVHSMGDMLITMALASTIFFTVPTDEARGRVALYLAVTMAPFVLLAPVIGPLLDRLPHGRRAAMSAALLFRGLLALLMTAMVAGGGVELYPAALGVLVASKAYNIVRAAVVPRLLPQRISLVKANARITLTGLIAAGVAAPLGLALHLIGPAGPLYGAFVLTLAGALMCFRLPRQVDLAKGEHTLRLQELTESRAEARTARDAGDAREPAADDGDRRKGGGRGESSGGWGTRNAGRGGRRLRIAPRFLTAWRDRPRVLRATESTVFKALIANSALRVLSGFALFFLAFLLREQPLSGQTAALSLGVVGVAAGVGNGVGNLLGAWARDRAPEAILLTMLALALASTVAAALSYGTFTVVVVSAVAGLCQAMGKLALDALIQRDVPEVVRTSAFARSETIVQMAWVGGGVLGISLPLIGAVGMGAIAVVIAAALAATVRGLVVGARRGTPHPHVR